MLTKLEKERASTFRSATMRASYMSINRLDVQQAVKQVARSMTEPNEGARGVLKRLVRYHVVQVRESAARGHRQRLCWMRAYPEGHDVCSSFPWRQHAQSQKLNAGYAQLECCQVGVPCRSQRWPEFVGRESMMIVFGEDVGQCVLGTDSSSAKSIMERRAGRSEWTLARFAQRNERESPIWQISGRRR